MCFYRLIVHRGRKGERRSFSEADYAAAITAAHQQWHAPIILIWDNLNTHLSARMHTFINAHTDWLTMVRLPAYAPDLNPVEGVWAHMKNGLGNLSASTVDQLAATVKSQLKRIQYRPELLEGVPHPDRTHPRTRAPIGKRPQPFNLCSFTAAALLGCRSRRT
jgi:putative transposase